STLSGLGYCWRLGWLPESGLRGGGFSDPPKLTNGKCAHGRGKVCVEGPMDVVGFGRGIHFSNVPPGGLFLASKGGRPHVCIRLGAPAEDACAVLFSPEGTRGGPCKGQPGVARFSAWFHGHVLYLDGVTVVLSPDPTDFAFTSESIEAGEIVVTEDSHHLKVRNNDAAAFTNLDTGQLTGPRPPVPPPWAVCLKWSLRSDLAVATTEIPGCSFPPRQTPRPILAHAFGPNISN